MPTDSALTTHDVTLLQGRPGRRGARVRLGLPRPRPEDGAHYYCFPGDDSDEARHNAPPPGLPDLAPFERADAMAPAPDWETQVVRA